MKTIDVEDVYELTPLQHGLLYHCLSAPAGGFYIEQMHFSVRGDLRVNCVRRAWERIITRHPALRTSFSWDDINRPVQIVHRTARLPLDEVDLRGLDEAEQERRFTEMMLQERRRGFDLEAAPLLRLTIFRLGDDVYRLAWRFSHLILDGWSFGLLMGDFVTLYKALYHDRPAALAEPSLPRTYVAWWKRQDTPNLRDYWREQLTGYRLPAPLFLGDRPTPTTDPVRHHYADLRLGALAQRLRDVSRQEGLTLNTLVQGAWTLLLSRCLDSDDVVVGATMSHRPGDLPDCEMIVGPLIATVPIRSHVRPDLTVREWLQALQATIIGAREHAGVPLPEIRACADAPLSTELFETIVSFENVPIPEISFAEENMAYLSHDVDGRPQYPMSLVVLPGDDMPLRLVYDRQRFGEAAAHRMLERLRRTLTALVDSVDGRVRDVDVVPDQERAQILRLSRRTRRYPVDATLADVVREHAARTPDRIAVTAEDASLTYRELVDRAERVAARLRDGGVRRGDRVAICVDRSSRLVVGILGILLARAAYVPLDPTNPAQRLAFLLRDSGASALVTEDAHADVGASAAELPVVRLDQELPSVDGTPEAEPGSPDDIAYVVYTSGSTGAPKGVLVTHANVRRLVEGAREELGLSADDVWSMFFSPAFDGAVWETWGALLTGARLVVVSHWVSRTPESLVDLLAREQVTVCTQSPSAFQQLVAAEAERPATLEPRVVVLGGEEVVPVTLRDWFARHGDRTRVLNAYGPTEATVWVCGHSITAAEATAADAPSLIGTPLPDTGIYLLDDARRPVPLGAPGAMFLAGPGVAAGYLDRPELTTARFTADPFAADAGARMYDSGDRARLRGDGELEYLGRADEQVKVRGFRVEPGEVAGRLREHPDVGSMVVTVRTENGEERLVAYVVPTAGRGEGDGSRVDPDGLRQFCAETLPGYMVPAVRLIDRIPLTPNGKVDHEALPAAGVASAGRAHVEPRNDTERRMAELVADLLSVPAVGVEDNLVDAGLHSLVATRLVSRIRATWRVTLPLRTLFETPTVAALAAVVQAGGVSAGFADRPGYASLDGEAVLDDDTVVAGTWTWTDEPGHVLVTGATGFPGAYLVAELARTTDAVVHCLIRARDGDDGRRRLHAHLESLGLWEDRFAGRIEPVPGDLSQPLLGLASDEFRALADRTDHIYHFGAQVNFVHPYRRLRAANVQGTKEILRLATTGKVSVLHHVSGVGVLSARDATDATADIPEDELGPHAPRLPNGYSETKWVAERLVTEAAHRGLPVVIHRLGRVTGDSRTGVWRAEGDALGELVRAAVGLGKLPEFDGRLDMAPVDFVAAAIAEAGRRPDAVGRILHLVNPDPPSFADLRRGFALAGHPAGSAGMRDWYAELVDRASATGEDWTVAITLLGEWVQNAREGMRQPTFASERTTRFLGDAVRCPRVDEQTLVRYLDHLAATGFLARPVPEGDQPWLAVASTKS
ncbi:non-ribosomal peptide synthetase [Salinispora arenicola]|uniref:Amino acid adenylation domain-containing protein/thioester reductase-like protein n=1 Tax=Salinispora arenicola TaxID=168697 RepID=A0A542XNX7_SALAC|nr:non-ribosomal peptide synthetase [Salinispora arenicola]TQL37539.1 amino acid adenylation domain-containing protein/thioester reductase-like protein [Salinispora arenicola]GIM87130.1 hypothetical protein Sar04_38660 [Salinispora arenicola]